MKLKSSGTRLVPSDGLPGLFAHFRSDAVSGFIVFLLAMPLSIGIAKASDFPPLMGLLTAIIGGLLVSFFSGSLLSIKGPAAGLIVIVAGAVADFGGGVQGWQSAVGAVFIASLLQILFGLLRFGRFVDFFPLTVVRGILASIGLIIILKQIPVLLNVDPSLSNGKSPLELAASIPLFFQNLDYRATAIGLFSLGIMLYWGKIKHTFLSKIPAALLVLLVAVPAAWFMDFRHALPSYFLVHIGDLSESIGYNLSFGGFSQPATFIRYVLMFALVGSLESLLTVKAVDMSDPWRRRSDANLDLIAVGIGNACASLLGGLPMISEVARSSANISNGAHTRWSNFFHGFFLLFFLLTAVQFIELIPNPALAAMLIAVGIRLAHLREFIHVFEIGLEQLAIFLVTIFITLYEDLLVGIASGIVLKLVLHLVNGVPLQAMFRIPAEVFSEDDRYLIKLYRAALFSNYIGLKGILDAVPPGMKLEVDFSQVSMVDHTVLENLHRFGQDYESSGGVFVLTGLDKHVSRSKHQRSARKKGPV